MTTTLGRFGHLYNTACELLGGLSSLAPLLGRIVIAAIFIPSGWGKLHSLPDVINFFTTLGIPFPQYQAPFVATVELVGGALVLFGLGTRAAALLLLSTMVVALATAIWPDVEGVADFFAKDETVYSAILAQLIIVGAGVFSLDHALTHIVATKPGSMTVARGAVHG